MGQCMEDWVMQNTQHAGKSGIGVRELAGEVKSVKSDHIKTAIFAVLI